jgi:hypothetical protein
VSAQEDYIKRLRGVLTQVEAVLSAEEHADVQRLIDHDEGGEAMLTLAWILVEGGRRVSAPTIRDIRELAEGLVEPTDFPPNLDDCAVP